MATGSRVSRGTLSLAVGFLAGVAATLGCTYLLAYASASAEHTMQTNTPTPTAQGTENGAWVWTGPVGITPAYRDAIIATAKKNDIDTIYLKIDSYLGLRLIKNPADKAKYEKLFDTMLEDFIRTAHENGIAVDAEAGAPNWSEDGMTEQAFTMLEYVKEFNETHEAKFRGFQYDVEPYTLPLYSTNKAEVLTRFLALVDQTVTTLQGSDLRFSVVIPDFYDASAAGAPRFVYAGKIDYTYDHLLSILERKPGSALIVMAYRDHALGNDGAIDIAKDEVAEAQGSHTRIIVALEAGEVDDSGVSFYGKPKSEYGAAREQIRQAFSGMASYGGTATDYLGALQDL